LCYRPDKYIETSEHGLVIIAVNEADSGRYDCWMGGSLLCSYNITVDAHRCAPPGKSHDYQKVYSDWCHEFEKYKMAMKTWERKQAVSIELSLCIMYELLKEIGANTAEHIEKRSMACMKFIDLYAWKCFNINCHSQPSVQK
jgi:hypothetical protein